MTEQNPDTVTPLDGEEGDVTGVTKQFDFLTDDADDTSAVQEGTVRVATRRGHKFVLPNPGGEDFEVDSEGTDVPGEVVEDLIKASNGRLHVVEPATNEDEEV